ncbi:hypothetical protein F2Q68_00021428 [Brassica cretica]|uniref:ADF-H domain-containing protein n=1 Tax=Brassica cretica TaxID=69181 RepID=A0A8S9G2K0_BRACR|nr:hypothetical protein F2Q68_00021428 [Brassica cretica]
MPLSGDKFTRPLGPNSSIANQIQTGTTILAANIRSQTRMFPKRRAKTNPLQHRETSSSPRTFQARNAAYERITNLQHRETSQTPEDSFFDEISFLDKNTFLEDQTANAASGMAVEDECKIKFLELKSKRNYRFIIFRIDGQQVVVEKLGSPEENYDDFSNSLPANECRYAVFDFDFTTAENCQKSKIFFIAWSPDSSRVRMKMVYASSKDRFKRELDGIQVELQATDPSEMSFDIIKSRAL